MTTSKINIGHAPLDTGRPDSDLLPVLPPPHAAEIVPHPEGEAGGLENMPEEVLSEEASVADEIDHAGLDTVLPNEDQATRPITDDDKVVPEKWGQL